MTSLMPPDSHKISFKIIEAIKEHPVLYINDVKGIDIKLQDFRQKVWQYIADDLGLDANWIKLKWKNLRDTYCRIVKYKNKPNKGVRRKKWVFEDYLSFLTFPFEPNYEQQTCEVTNEYLQLINSNRISSEGLLEQLEDKNEEDYNEFLEVVQKAQASTSKEHITNKVSEINIPHNTAATKEIDKTVLAQQIEAKFRKIRPKVAEIPVIPSPYIASSTEIPVIIESQIEPPNKKQKLKNNIQNNSDEDTQSNVKHEKNNLEEFFDSMAKTVNNFSEDLQDDIKFNICRVIAEAESKSKKEFPVKKLNSISNLPKMLLIPCHMIDKVK